MRFYFRYTEASCTIIDRATHDLIGFLDVKQKEDARKQLMHLCNMSIEEYVVYCMDKGVKFKTDRGIEFIYDKDSEDWATKAWISTTERALKDLDAIGAIPSDIVTISIVNDVKANKPSKSTMELIASTEATNAVLEANTLEEDAEASTEADNKEIGEKMHKIDKDANNKPRKLSKKLKPSKPTNTKEEDEKPILGANKGKKLPTKKKVLSSKTTEEDATPKYTKEILRELFASKKIDINTYRNEMRKLL